MVFYHIADIQKNPEGIHFDQELNLTAVLKERNPEILDLSPISVKGHVRFEAGFFLLDYQMSYQITMASSRSLEPVNLDEVAFISEVFVADEKALKEQDLIEDELVLVIEDDIISLDDSVADNILLNIPIKVLTPEEEAGQVALSGQDWTVMTEEEFQQAAQEKKEASSPFAQLQGLFDEE